MLADKLHLFLISPITWGITGFIIVAITLSGKWNLNYANILFIIVFLIGCFEISRTGAVIHLRIIFCLLLGIGLTTLSWWITPNHPKSKSEQSKKSPSTYIIADCTFDIIFKISDQNLKILQASQQGIENGNIFANVDIFEKEYPYRFIQLAITGDWHNTEARSGSIENLTLFSLSSKQFKFSRKKPTIVNAQSGMTNLFSNRKYSIQIHGVTTADSKALILSATSATIQTHEGIVFFPTTEFKRLDGSLNEYWQADFTSVPIRN